MCGCSSKNNAHACLLYSEFAANKSVGAERSDSGLVDALQARLLNRIKLLDNNFIKGGGGIVGLSRALFRSPSSASTPT